MRGKILKFAQPTKGIQIEAVFKGVVTPLWCDVPRELLHILERPYAIGDEVDFLYTPNAKGNGRTLTKCELIKTEQMFEFKEASKLAEDILNTFSEPKVGLIKSEYAEREEFKQRLIVRQNCLSHATAILCMMPQNIDRTYLVNTTKEIAEELEDWVWGESDAKK